jgi:hypothetical protein
MPWDSNMLDSISPFGNLYAWLFSVIDYAKNRKDLQFIIRCHPAEAFDKNGYNYKPVKETILEKIFIPSNVKIVGGNEPVCSYTLGLNSDVIMVYSGTLGFEFAFLGKRPWVFADCYYANKGFTLDIKSYEHMKEYLDTNYFENNLTQEQIRLAEKVFYWSRIRSLFPFSHMKNNIFNPPNFDFIIPGKNKSIDEICNCILEEKPFFASFDLIKEANRF